MSRDAPAPGAAGLHLVDGLSLLRPEKQVFDAMLDGWRNQQLARNLAFSTIEGRHKAVKAFTRHADTFPWTWSAQMLDEWLGDLRTLRDLKRSTLRGYSEAVRSFCVYLTDPAYSWPTECEMRFGTHPTQIAHEWKTAVHLQETESDPAKRAFTRAELVAFFDKGWLPAFRDATLFKTAYAFGLRRNETRMLDLVDFSRNPHAPAFGDFGVCQVRHGKAKKGSPPKRRGVLTVGPRHGTGGMDWIADVLQQWTQEVRPAFAHADSPALWPSERGPRIGFTQMHTRFAAYRDAVGRDPALDLHSFRRSYVTHLIEDGWDARFVQEQGGHEHASTTALYTCVLDPAQGHLLALRADRTARRPPRRRHRPHPARAGAPL